MFFVFLAATPRAVTDCCTTSTQRPRLQQALGGVLVERDESLVNLELKTIPKTIQSPFGLHHQQQHRLVASSLFHALGSCLWAWFCCDDWRGYVGPPRHTAPPSLETHFREGMSGHRATLPHERRVHVGPPRHTAPPPPATACVRVRRTGESHCPTVGEGTSAHRGTLAGLHVVGFSSCTLLGPVAGYMLSALTVHVPTAFVFAHFMAHWRVTCCRL